jgi:hypothetical protein
MRLFLKHMLRNQVAKLKLSMAIRIAIGIIALASAASAQIIQGAPVVADTNSTGGQSGSSVYVDTTKLPGSTPDAQISACLANNSKCDASKEPSATLLASTITISQSGVVLVLGSLTLPTGWCVE